MGDWVYLDVAKIKRITDAAILLVLADEEETEVWIPLSQLADDTDQYEEGDKDLTITVSQWIAEKKGII